MPFPFRPAPGCAEVKLTYVFDNQALQNVFHIQQAGAWTQAELAALVDIFDAWSLADGGDVRSSETVLKQIRAIDLTSSDGAYYARDLGVGYPGQLIEDSLPANVTIAVQAATNKRGRGVQGRIFFCGLVDSQREGNQLLGAAETLIQNAYNALLAAIEAGTGGEMCVLHGVRGGELLDPRDTTPVVTWLIGDLTLDVQDNRLPNHKRRKAPAA